jgi:hypothetical protein
MPEAIRGATARNCGVAFAFERPLAGKLNHAIAAPAKPSGEVSHFRLALGRLETAGDEEVVVASQAPPAETVTPSAILTTG